MKVLRVLDSSGDRVIAFDHTPDTASARAEAQALFERMLGAGSVAFKVHRGAGAPDEKASDFSALEDETIMVPRLVAG